MPIDCLKKGSVIGSLNLVFLLTVEVEEEAGLGRERALLDVSHNLFWEVVLHAAIELKGSVTITIVGGNRAVVLLHVLAATAPSQMDIND